MAQLVRLCLLLENTAAMNSRWADIRGSIVEPVLRSLTGQAKCELALVLFGSVGFSPVVVQSSLWTQDASTLRQWLDDVEFCGGGNQPVALAEALLEAAALLELPTALEPPAQGPGAGVPAQQQLKSRCLVCMVSEPSTNAVAWPYPSAYGQWARLPGLATSLELVHALTTQMCVALALATRLRTGQHFSTPLVLHWLHTMAQPQAPPGPVDQYLKEHQAEWRALAKCIARTAGGSVAVFPHWEAGLQAVLAYNGQAAAQVAGRLPGTPGTLEGDTPSPYVAPSPAVEQQADTPGTGPLQTRVLTPQLGAVPSPPVGQLRAPTPPPGAAGAGVGQFGAPPPVASPGAAAGGGGGGFMELMSMPSNVVASSAQQLVAPTQQQQPQQQQQYMQPPPTAYSPAAQPPQAAAPAIVRLWQGPLKLSDRVRGPTPGMLATVELHGKPQARNYGALLPAELVINKFVSARQITGEMQSQSQGLLQMHVVVKQWWGGGEGAMQRVAAKGAAGVLDLPQGYTGVLFSHLKEEDAALQTPGQQPKLALRFAIYRR